MFGNSDFADLENKNDVGLSFDKIFTGCFFLSMAKLCDND